MVQNVIREADCQKIFCFFMEHEGLMFISVLFTA